jgi:hypothetical protein
MRKVLWVTGALLLTGIVPAGAAVLCQKKSAAVVVRDPGCKKRETQLNLALFGAVGPKGDAGTPGTPGTPGTARAYAHVTRDGSGGVILDLTRSFGVASAELPSTGNDDRPCVVLDPSIDATKTAAVVSVDSQNTPTFNTAVATVRVGGEGSQGCPSNSIAIFVRRNDGSGGSDIAFNVVVP